MSFHFDTLKAVQCAAHLLAKYPEKSHNYTCLLKMLYMADRRSIEETGAPITGDRPFALDNGPVLSAVYDLIRCKGPEDSQALWSRYLETTGYNLAIVMDAGDGRLSDYEAGVLDRVFAEYGSSSLGRLIEATHAFPEWIASYHEGTSSPISLSKILKAVGREDDYDEISRAQVEDARFAALFGG